MKLRFLHHIAEQRDVEDFLETVGQAGTEERAVLNSICSSLV